MNNSTAYTPLECLLVFQSLVTYGVEDKSFTTISDLITNNALVKNGETYDPARLKPEALQELYLHLLREELKSEHDGQQDAGQSVSKKRKIPSPILPTIKDAQEYKEKLPLLVERLYARYTDHIVRGIREDERQYAALGKEIEDLERMDEAERILMEDRAKANKNGSHLPKDSRPKTNGTGPIVASIEQTAEVPAPALPKGPAPSIPSPVASPRPDSRPEGLGIKEVLNTRTPPIQSPPKPEQRPLNGNQNVPPPSGPLQPPQQPGMAYTWEPPYQAGQPHPGHYQGLPYSPYNQPPYPQGYPPPPRGSFPGPHGVLPPHLQVPSSPHNAQNQVLLPPQNPVRRSPGSPGLPLDALADAAGQQYRAPSGSPMPQQSPFTPGGYAYPPQQRPPSGQIPANGPPLQWNQQYPPPYQGSPQQFFPPNQRPPFPVPPNLVSTENRQYNSPYNASQGPRPPMPVSAAGTPRPMFPGTPIGHPLNVRTTGSGTRWTPQPLTASSPAVPYAYMQSPAYEPLSPVLRPAKTTVLKKPPKVTTPISDVPKGKPGPKWKRGLKKRATSPVTSRRSTSILSHDDVQDELSLDVKEEVNTPLPLGEEDSGDTTADEASSLPPPRRPMSRGKRPSKITTSPAGLKRKRDESSLNTPVTPREPSIPPTHVLWTRNFGKISHSAQDFVTTHRLASLFAHPIKEQHAPGYSNIILRPQDLKSIKASIAAGQKAAMEKEKSLGADSSKSDTSVWLPISEELVPPKGIINYAQLEKELMRMFANAIMFNPDPQRGFGDRLGRQKDKRGGDGYEFDEDGVVKDARAMQADVEKMIGDLRAAEQVGAKGFPVIGRQSSVVRGSSIGRGGSVRGGSLARGSSIMGSSVAATEDEVDELAGDMDGMSNAGGSLAKRRRKA